MAVPTLPPQLPPQDSLLKRIFVSPTENRPRAGWRLLGQGIIQWVLVVILILMVGFVLAAGGDIGLSPDATLLTGQLLSAVAITLSVWIARGYLDKRPFAGLGLHWDRRALFDLIVGLLIPLAIFAVIFILLRAQGHVVVLSSDGQGRTAGAIISSLFLYFSVFVITAWQEELLIRGYWLQNLAEGLNLILAVLLSSAFFGILHLLNPHASPMAALLIFIGGLFFAFAYLQTRQLWLPIGLHLGWNFVEGPLFGFPVSGIPTPGLLTLQVTGPQWLTGGEFGPEAGLILLPGMAVGFLLVFLYTGRFREKV